MTSHATDPNYALKCPGRHGTKRIAKTNTDESTSAPNTTARPNLAQHPYRFCPHAISYGFIPKSIY